MNTLTPNDIAKMKYTGYLHGEYFSGEWYDGSPMAGYGIYWCEDGGIPSYGDFSETGDPADAVDAGDLIESADEESGFEIVEWGCGECEDSLERGDAE